jgi:dTDP-L-rhamnose 4-epimerase
VSGRRVLVTGGAGFIGSHVVDALLARGDTVTVLDALVPQVHGPARARPAYLAEKAELIVGDVGDVEALGRALRGVDAIVHLAAAVGVGQSMYEIASYVAANTQATAVMLQVLSEGGHGVRKLVVASSMSIYGEGAHACARCGEFAPEVRDGARLRARVWDVVCPGCGTPASPIPTREDKPLVPTSIYAITKRDHEEMCLCVGAAYGIPSCALRFFNVYGQRQALSNPYTGVAAIFSSRLLNDHAPLIYEDGCQSRDFTHVADIVQAVVLALDRPESEGQVFNVGTGEATPVSGVATILAEVLGKPIPPRITGEFRAGDIRHCVADISKISRALGYRPHVRFAEGMAGLAGWIRGQHPEDAVAAADERLRQRGLVR